MKQFIADYIIKFAWAIVGSLSMGVSIIITLKLFTLSTRNLDEWKEIKEKNIAVAIIIASVILSCAWVVSSIIRP